MTACRYVLAAVAGLSAATPAIAEPLKVVATFSILGDLSERVGGDLVEVTTLVGPDGDAHVYQPTPADAKAIAAADVVVINGMGFEGFLERLTDAAGYKGPIVTASRDVVPLDGMAAGEDHEDQGQEAAAGHEEADHDEAGHDHGAVDPHAWQSATNGAAYAAAIADGFCAAEPAGCDTFRRNAEALRGELEGLDADIRSRVAAIPETRRQVITSHDAFGYFEAAYGVRFIAPQGVSTESEASARDVANLIRQIRETGIKVVFVENIADPRLIQQIASETGATVGGSLFSDALSGPDGPAGSYVEMMRHNADALISAMEQNS